MALSDEEVLWNISLGYVGEYQIEDTADSRLSKQYGLCNRFYPLARDTMLKRHNWDEAIERVIITQDSTNPLFEYGARFSVPSDSLRIVSVSDRDTWGNPGNGDILPWEVSGDFILTNLVESAPSWQTDRRYVAGQYVVDTILAWITGTAYLINQTVSSGGSQYKAAEAHTSGTFATDLAAGKWTLIESTTNSTYLCNTTHTSASGTRPNTQTDTTTWTSQGDDLGILNVTYVKQLTDIDKFTPLFKNVVAMQLASMIITSLHNDPKAKTALLNEIEQLLLPQARAMDAQQGKPKKLFSSRFRRSRWSGWGWF